MKNIKLAIFLIWGLSNISCNFSSTNISQGTVKPNIVKAIIVDHVPNTHNAGRLIVTNNEDLEAIGNEIKLVKEIQDTIELKNNFGFYELTVYYVDGKESHIDIIYTVYNGVIINSEDTHKCYKNDRFEGLVIKLLSNSR